MSQNNLIIPDLSQKEIKENDHRRTINPSCKKFDVKRNDVGNTIKENHRTLINPSCKKFDLKQNDS